MSKKKVQFISLKELCNVNQGLQIPISKRFREKGENRYFYITVQFLKGSPDDEFYIENPPKSSICDKEDIIVVRTGSTGQVLTGIEGCFHNNFFKVNYFKEKIYGRFLYHCLNTKEKQKEMKARSGITTIPDLNHFMFLDMKIPYFKYETQKSISNAIDSILNKIDLNNKINSELEAMAKTLYDYWFVQFDFPNEEGKPYKSSGGAMEWNEELKREIPVGWDNGTLSNISDIVRGVSYNKDDILCSTSPNTTPILRATNITGNKLDLNDMVYIPNEFVSEKQLLNKFDILLTMSSGSKEHIGKNGLFLYDKKVAFGAFCAKLVAKQNFQFFLYEFTQSNNYFNTIKNVCLGTNINNLNGPLVMGFETVIPKEDVLIGFNNKVVPIFEKIRLNILENQELASLRDWLLPMLMNGQVSVK